jgi:hypothetical protein
MYLMASRLSPSTRQHLDRPVYQPTSNGVDRCSGALMRECGGRTLPLQSPDISRHIAGESSWKRQKNRCVPISLEWEVNRRNWKWINDAGGELLRP